MFILPVLLLKKVHFEKLFHVLYINQYDYAELFLPYAGKGRKMVKR